MCAVSSVVDAMSVTIGSMRDRVTAQQPSGTADGQGGSVRTWADVETCWARVETATTVEVLSSDRVAAVVTHQVTIWYQTALASIGATWRFLWGSRVLEIQSVENVDSRNRVIRALCREVQA